VKPSDGLEPSTPSYHRGSGKGKRGCGQVTATWERPTNLMSLTVEGSPRVDASGRACVRTTFAPMLAAPRLRGLLGVARAATALQVGVQWQVVEAEQEVRSWRSAHHEPGQASLRWHGRSGWVAIRCAARKVLSRLVRCACLRVRRG